MHNRIRVRTIISSIYLLALYCKDATCLQQQQQQQQQPQQPQHQQHQQQQQPQQQQQLNQATPLLSSIQDKSSLQQSNAQMRSELPTCTLGNDTYRLGERWNPNLPPFGVQVCVQCECVVKHRKDCYEVKVACRRITNECPIIESCPDGKKPVTTAGQCCKSCQSATGADAGQPSSQTFISDDPRQLSPAAAALISQERTQASVLNGQLEHNDRIKSYHLESKDLKLCQKKEAEKHVRTSPVKTSKGNKHDLNGIEPRIAFKSLQGSQNLASMSSSAVPKGRQEISPDKPIDDTLRHDHQHPNDVQSSSQGNQVQQATVQTKSGQPNQPSSQSVSVNNKKRLPPPDSFKTCLEQQQHNQVSFITTGQGASGRQRSDAQIRSEPPTCLLGSETYQLEERWNPNLPPFGVQVCVRCECVLKSRKNCFEAKVACRRITHECPMIESCPDGRKPVTTAGQCCKSCQSAASADGQTNSPQTFSRAKGNHHHNIYNIT